MCDNATGEVRPIWPGHPLTAHWGISDPTAQKGADATKRAALQAAFSARDRKVSAFIELPFESYNAATLTHALRAIGKL